MIDQILRFILPAAYALLPPEMASAEATAMLLAIGLQESHFRDRRQFHGPARGFWQFEISGTAGVLNHHGTRETLAAVQSALCYEPTLDGELLHPVLEDNDVMACCFARALLWTDPRHLVGPQEAGPAWSLYVDCWRPGRPHPETWADNYAEAWRRTIGVRAFSQELKA